MDSKQYFYNEGGIKTNKHKILGGGAYGCAISPGLDCKGKINKYVYKVNKIQEINFNSKNELQISELVKKIKSYKKRFIPINKFCIVKFNKIENSKDIINGCENLFDSYSKSDTINFINKEYFMFYMHYVKGTSPKNYLLELKNLDSFYNKFFYSFYYLLNSIYLLNKVNIVHNDLHYNNIIYDIVNDVPLIIDFGLSFKYKSLFKNLKGFDYKIIKNFFFDWRENMGWHLTDKRFISFIIDNYSQYYQANVSNDFTENDLTKKILDIFIDDTYHSFLDDPQISFIFQDYEFKEFYNALQNYYYKFLPENDIHNKYKYYSSILQEILPFVLKYNDLHSLVSAYLSILYKKIYQENLEYKSDILKYNNILDFIKSLIKKVYYPDPYYRLSIKQFISIFNFVFKFCQSINVNHLNDNKYIEQFYLDFKLLLNEIHYDYNMFFNKNYAYVDFYSILKKDNVMLIKKFDFYII